jgi:hypothetical protein
MIKTHLSSGEIQDLINRYNSEWKKLEFQIEEVKMTISGLENLMNDVSSREKASFTKVKIKSSNISDKPLSKKLKKTESKKSKVKSTSVPRPRKGIAKKTVSVREKTGYKLSDWDNFVIQSIEQSGKTQITSEIIDFVKIKMAATGKKTNENEIKNKVTRSLQKLVNRRGDLSKVSYKGKGFAYALPQWVGANGKILPAFKH